MNTATLWSSITGDQNCTGSVTKDTSPRIESTGQMDSVRTTLRMVGVSTGNGVGNFQEFANPDQGPTSTSLSCKTVSFMKKLGGSLSIPGQREIDKTIRQIHTEALEESARNAVCSARENQDQSTGSDQARLVRLLD